MEEEIMRVGQSSDVKIALAQTMVDELEDYLLGDALYRQLVVHTPAGDQLPKMTIGRLIQTLHDLQVADDARQLTADQRSRLLDIRQCFERLRDRFPTAYRDKLAWELKSNLDSWQWFLQECTDHPQRCREDYPLEVRIRNRIALIVDALKDHVPANLAVRLERLDHQLQAIWSPGGFVLSPALKDRYPRDRYWWLYGRPAGDVRGVER